MVQKTACLLPDGSDAGALNETQTELLQKWRQWSYYKLCYKEIE